MQNHQGQAKLAQGMWGLKKKEKGKKNENVMGWGKKKKTKDKYLNMKGTGSEKKEKKNILK